MPAAEAGVQTDGGGTGVGVVPILDSVNARSTRASHSTGAQPQSLIRHPSQSRSPSPSLDTNFALNLPWLGWAFGAPSSFSLFPPTDPFILLLAAAWRPGPGIQEELQPGLAVPGGTQLPTRSFRGGGHSKSWAVAAQNDPWGVAHTVSRRAGVGSQCASASSAPRVLRTRPEPRASLRCSAGERCKPRQGGRGRAQGCKERRREPRRKETGRRGTSFTGANGSWVLRETARRRNTSRN